MSEKSCCCVQMAAYENDHGWPARPMPEPIERITLARMDTVEALEAGVLSDDPQATVHAVHMTLHGPEALCGAGPIVGRVLKRFGEADRHTCLACFAAALPAPHTTR